MFFFFFQVSNNSDRNNKAIDEYDLKVVQDVLVKTQLLSSLSDSDIDKKGSSIPGPARKRARPRRRISNKPKPLPSDSDEDENDSIVNRRCNVNPVTPSPRQTRLPKTPSGSDSDEHNDYKNKKINSLPYSKSTDPVNSCDNFVKSKVPDRHEGTSDRVLRKKQSSVDYNSPSKSSKRTRNSDRLSSGDDGLDTSEKQDKPKILQKTVVKLCSDEEGKSPVKTGSQIHSANRSSQTREPSSEKEESPPKLDSDGLIIQDKKKNALRKLFSVSKGGSKGAKGPKVVVESIPDESDEKPIKVELLHMPSSPADPVEMKKVDLLTDSVNNSVMPLECGRLSIICSIDLSRLSNIAGVKFPVSLSTAIASLPKSDPVISKFDKKIETPKEPSKDNLFDDADSFMDDNIKVERMSPINDFDNMNDDLKKRLTPDVKPDLTLNR